MSIEALVQPPIARVIGTWESNHASRVHTFPRVRLGTIAGVAVKNGHRYKVSVSAAGLMLCAAASRRTYAIEAGADVVVSQRLGYDRGGFTAVMTVPIRMIGLWMATADASVDFHFVVTKAASGDVVDELAPAYHSMQVIDLGK